MVASGDCAVPELKARTERIFAPGAMPMPLARGNGADHAGAMGMRPLVAADGVVLYDHRAGEIGMVTSMAGVDHRDQDVVSGRDLVRLVEVQLADDILLRVGGCAGEPASGLAARSGPAS